MPNKTIVTSQNAHQFKDWQDAVTMERFVVGDVIVRCASCNCVLHERNVQSTCPLCQRDFVAGEVGPTVIHLHSTKQQAGNSAVQSAGNSAVQSAANSAGQTNRNSTSHTAGDSTGQTNRNSASQTARNSTGQTNRNSTGQTARNSTGQTTRNSARRPANTTGRRSFLTRLSGFLNKISTAGFLISLATLFFTPSRAQALAKLSSFLDNNALWRVLERCGAMMNHIFLMLRYSLELLLHQASRNLASLPVLSSIIEFFT